MFKGNARNNDFQAVKFHLIFRLPRVARSFDRSHTSHVCVCVCSCVSVPYKYESFVSTAFCESVFNGKNRTNAGMASAHCSIAEVLRVKCRVSVVVRGVGVGGVTFIRSLAGHFRSPSFDPSLPEKSTKEALRKAALLG